MRISCDLEISNRLFPSLNIRCKKCTHGVVTLGRKGVKSDGCNDICIIVSTKQNPSGDKYRVCENIQQVFVKFIKQGKLTIRFNEPPHDLIIKKADSLQLKGFCQALQFVLQKKDVKFHLSQPPTKIEIPKTKICIRSQVDYYTLKSTFPRTLTVLTIQDSFVKSIDNCILSLKSLQTLDLCNNEISTLPFELSNLKLSKLLLSRNYVEEFPIGLCTGNIQKSLTTLDLNNNKITTLPDEICSLEKLQVLSIGNNNLLSLPINIGKISTLRVLNAYGNHIKMLPYSIINLNLEALDLYQNPLDAEITTECAGQTNVAYLLELAACAILKNRLKYGEEDLPQPLINYLSTVCQCPCGQFVFQKDFQGATLIDSHRLAATLTVDRNKVYTPIQIVCCSLGCWTDFVIRQRL